MILEIQHETCFSYPEPVTEAVTEVRMEPASDGDQSCRSFHLDVAPETDVHRYGDGFGNRVHHFNLLLPHRDVRILSASIVETHPQPRSLEACPARWPLELEGEVLDVLDFVQFRGPVRPTPKLTPVLETLQPRSGQPLAQLVTDVMSYIRANFEYARDVTLASSPVDDVLATGKGVCQDFTHLMIAVLRSFGAPARYVSGYIHRPNKESQSHAWCETWLPGLGWVGVDPTNGKMVDDHFVKVAVGRDFTDVPPNKGVYRGRARQSIFVRVETRELDRLPSLSWQEQLPPLNVPLTAIRSTPGTQSGRYEDDSQQQQ